MALLTLFGGKPDREPQLRDPEQILAWFEELTRIRTPMHLRLHEDDPHGPLATVALTSEAKGTFTLAFQHQLSAAWKEGQLVHLTFALDGQRFRASARYEGLGGYLQRVFTLPEVVRHAERRERPRTRFTAREGVSVAALEGLFEGLGLSGPLLNLGHDGLAFRVDRAMDIARGRRLTPGEDLAGPGHAFGLVRLQDLPHLPTLECGAVLIHLEARERGVVAGLRLEGLGGLERQGLDRLLAHRLPAAPMLGFPRKRRRGVGGEGSEAAEAPEPQEIWAEAGTESEAESDPGMEAAPDPASEALSDRALLEIRVAMAQPDRLMALRKRGRKLLVAVPDDLARAALVTLLQVDGYREVLEARSLVQALEGVRHREPDALLIWHRVGPHEGLDLVDKVREHLGGRHIPAVILEEAPEVRHKLALKGGRIEGVLGHPVDYDGILRGLLEKILGLSPAAGSPVE